jgi:hypothetical protein
MNGDPTHIRSQEELRMRVAARLIVMPMLATAVSVAAQKHCPGDD